LTFQAGSLAGNVWEWTQSVGGDYPYRVEDGRKVPDAEGLRVLRGGSWGGDARGARCARCGRFVPDLFSDVVGFRVGVSLANSDF
jgi:formylglycine-generating enzyme required for sulfatase activity